MSGLTRYELGILGGGKIGLVPLEKPIGKGWTPYDEACDALAAKDRELAALRAELAESLDVLRRQRNALLIIRDKQDCRVGLSDLDSGIDILDSYLSAHPAPPTIASDGSKG
jgi:hypothetical protein